MSKGRLVVLAVVAVAVLVFLLSAQARANRRKEGERILARYVEVTGGQQAYQSIKTQVIRGSGTFMGKPIVLAEYRAASGNLLAIMSSKDRFAKDPVDITEGTDGTNAWRISNQRPEVLIGSRKLDCLREAAIDRDARWRDFFKSVECVGTTDFAGRQCYKVIMVPLDGDPRTRYYDTDSYYLLGEESSPYIPGAAPQTALQIYEDYRKYGNIMLPARQTVRIGPVEMTAKIEEVVMDREIPDEQFATPPAIKILLVGLPAYMK